MDTVGNDEQVQAVAPLEPGRSEPRDRPASDTVVLLHGVTGSASMWRNVIPLLKGPQEVVALTALGHRGGRPGMPGARVSDLVDDAERSLDQLGLDRAYVVGNSLGGWMAIELARRGRATGVCALSPAGCWDVASGQHITGAAKLRTTINLARRTRRVMPWASKMAVVRRIALRDCAAHGERVSSEELLDLIDDAMACTLVEELLTTDEQVAPLDPLPCPVVLAWSELDHVLPIATIGARARTLMPQASWRVVPGVGHVPMLDDPRLAAAVIREAMHSATAPLPEAGRRAHRDRG